MNTISTKIKYFYSKNRLYLHCFLLFCLYLANCFIYEITYVLYPILLVLILLDSMTNASCYILFNIPFCLIGQRLGVILYVICMLSYLVRAYITIYLRDKAKPNLFILISTIALVILCLVPFTNLNSATFINISALVLLILLLNLYLKKQEIFNICLFINILAISILCSSVLGLFYPVSQYLQTLISPFALTENISRYSALFPHPNSLAILCEISLGLLTMSLLSKRDYLSIALFCAVSLIGISTFSKTFTIIFAILIIIIFVYGLTKNYKKTLIVTAILLALGACLILIFRDLFATMFDRFFGTIGECQNFRDFMNMLTTDRYDLWSEYLIEIFTNPSTFFFGKGMGAHTLHSLGAHNTFISMLYQMGILRLILFAVIIGYVIYRIVKTHGYNKYVWIPILVVALIFMIEDLLLFA